MLIKPITIHPITIHPLAGFAEPFSSLSHLLGAVLILAFAGRLFQRARGDSGRAMSMAIFVGTALFTLLMSGIYHMLPPHTAGKEFFLRLDHAGIFALIAGSFTPPHVILFRRAWRWGILTLIWGLAAVGMTLTTAYLNDFPEWFILLFYLAMGWIGLVSAIKASRSYGWAFLLPIFWGGLAYTIGALIDFARRPILVPHVIEAHEIFHVAVLIGLACHWRFMAQIADGHIMPVDVEVSAQADEIPQAESGQEAEATT